MTSFRRFTCDDLLSFSNVNLDKYTETYNFGFYMTYMDRWPEYFTVAQDITGRQMGYSKFKHTPHSHAHTHNSFLFLY